MRKSIKASSTVAIAVFLAGCATQAQQQAQAIRTNTQSAVETVKACIGGVYSSADADPIRDHLPMDVRQATLEQLSDASKITKVEAAAIFKVHPRLQECRHSALDQIAQTTPTFVPILANEYSKNDLLLVDLIQRKISWGEELKRARELVADATAELMQEGERIDAGLEQSHEAELARRQAAFNALSQYAQTQQIINNMNRPVVTNCNTFGNSTNCVTH